MNGNSTIFTKIDILPPQKTQKVLGIQIPMVTSRVDKLNQELQISKVLEYRFHKRPAEEYDSTRKFSQTRNHQSENSLLIETPQRKIKIPKTCIVVSPREI